MAKSKSSQIGVQQQAQIQSLTPQQLLVSNLTEMPVEALYERVDQELKENVSLERDSVYAENMDFPDAQDSSESADSLEYPALSEFADATDSSADYSSPDDIPDNQPSAHSADTEAVTQETQSFYDQLEEQIGFFHLLRAPKSC